MLIVSLHVRATSTVLFSPAQVSVEGVDRMDVFRDSFFPLGKT